MSQEFNSIGIFSTLKNERIISIARQCKEVLVNQNIKVLVTETLASLKEKKTCKVVSDSFIVGNADLLISIGGDGTLLSAARKFGSKGLPLLGINLGNLGFLTDVAPDEITQIITEVLRGKFTTDERFFLEAKIDSQKKPLLALNEVVIHSGSIAQLIEYEVYVDDIFVYRQRADGLIINSPTGSTAYSLSGGGPILHPNVKAITLLPMYPHSLSTSPLVVTDQSIIEIKMIQAKTKAQVSMDSHDSFTLKRGDVLTIKKAKPNLRLLHPSGHDFYSACRNKLGWSSILSRK